MRLPVRGSSSLAEWGFAFAEKRLEKEPKVAKISSDSLRTGTSLPQTKGWYQETRLCLDKPSIGPNTEGPLEMNVSLPSKFLTSISLLAALLITAGNAGEHVAYLADFIANSERGIIK